MTIEPSLGLGNLQYKRNAQVISMTNYPCWFVCNTYDASTTARAVRTFVIDVSNDS